MIYLFIHQSFPAQYLHLVSHLASQPGNEVYFITQMEQHEIAGVRKLVYRPDLPPGSNCHPYVAPYDAAVRTATAVMEVCRALRDAGTVPDLVIGHCGWGETLLVKDVFPDTPVLTYFEYYYRAEGADVGFDREFVPSSEKDAARLRVRNTINHMSFEASDWGHTATEWQRSLFPGDMQARIITLHEGIDTRRIRPNPDAWFKLGRNEIVLTCDEEVITYVARSLEPYRGFHCLMRALPEVLRRRPKAHVVVLGGDGVSYGDPPPYGGTYREMMLAELGDRIDLGRVHFLGQVPKDVYLNVLQVSSVHIYFTYPFVLSWSLLEAMSAGCLVLGSANQPVLEVLRDGVNGLATDMFSPEQICDRIDEVLEHPDRMRAVRNAARAAVVRTYDLHTQTLPRWLTLLDHVARSAKH
jgi:glycosyltransferase involved in cell wall biosynthesis